MPSSSRCCSLSYCLGLLLARLLLRIRDPSLLPVLPKTISERIHELRKARLMYDHLFRAAFPFTPCLRLSASASVGRECMHAPLPSCPVVVAGERQEQRRTERMGRKEGEVRIGKKEEAGNREEENELCVPLMMIMMIRDVGRRTDRPLDTV